MLQHFTSGISVTTRWKDKVVAVLMHHAMKTYKEVKRFITKVDRQSFFFCYRVHSIVHLMFNYVLYSVLESSIK